MPARSSAIRRARGTIERMAKRERSSKLPPARVLVVGVRAHGPEDVTEGLRVLASGGPLSERSRPGAERDDERYEFMIVNDFGPSIGAPTLARFDTEKRSYTAWTCVDGAASVALTMNRRADAVVLVHSARGPFEERVALELLEAAAFLGAEYAVIYVSDAPRELDRGALEARERQLREALSLAGFDGDNTPVTYETGPVAPRRGEAWRAGIAAVRDALDEQSPQGEEPAPETLVRVNRAFMQGGRALAVGYVERGELSVGQTLELVSERGVRPATVLELEVFRRRTERATKGTSAGIYLANVALEEIAPMAALAPPGGVRMVSALRGRAFVWRPLGEGPTSPAPVERTRTAVMVGGELVAARIEWAEPRDAVFGAVNIELRLQRAVPWCAGTTASLFDAERSFGLLHAEPSG